MIEFAFVFVLLVMLAYGIAVFGVLLSTKNTLTHAAAEGARSSLDTPYVPTNTLDARRVTKATDSVATALRSLGSNYHATDTTATIAGCSGPTDTEKCMTVTITYPWSQRPLIAEMPGIGLVTPNNITATAVVRLP